MKSTDDDTIQIYIPHLRFNMVKLLETREKCWHPRIHFSSIPPTDTVDVSSVLEFLLYTSLNHISLDKIRHFRKSIAHSVFF